MAASTHRGRLTLRATSPQASVVSRADAVSGGSWLELRDVSTGALAGTESVGGCCHESKKLAPEQDQTLRDSPSLEGFLIVFT
jgi:hypothetical protein